jgi:hypothetical protein
LAFVVLTRLLDGERRIGEIERFDIGNDVVGDDHGRKRSRGWGALLKRLTGRLNGLNVDYLAPRSAVRDVRIG